MTGVAWVHPTSRLLGIGLKPERNRLNRYFVRLNEKQSPEARPTTANRSHPWRSPRRKVTMRRTRPRCGRPKPIRKITKTIWPVNSSFSRSERSISLITIRALLTPTRNRRPWMSPRPVRRKTIDERRAQLAEQQVKPRAMLHARAKSRRRRLLPHHCANRWNRHAAKRGARPADRSRGAALDRRVTGVSLDQSECRRGSASQDACAPDSDRENRYPLPILSGDVESLAAATGDRVGVLPAENATGNY